MNSANDGGQVHTAASARDWIGGQLSVTPVQAHETGMPHLIHEYEGWVAPAVVVLALTSTGLLLRGALRR